MSWRGAALGAALAALAYCLGLFAPGAPKRKRSPSQFGVRRSEYQREWHLRHTEVCACVRYPSADGTVIDGNCGLGVSVRGAVRVKDDHVPPPGYDHEAIMAQQRALNTRRRRAQRGREQAALTASIITASGRWGESERTAYAPTYQDARDIFADNGGILLSDSPSRRCGLGCVVNKVAF